MTTHSATAPRLPWDAADPFPFYEQRRREGDVVWDGTAQAWLVLGYHAAQHVLGGPGWTIDPMASVGAELFNQSMLFADGANHLRLRRAVRDVFTPTFIAGLSAGVEAIAAAVIEHTPTAVAFDFMADIALPLPLAVIGEWLGLDPESSQLVGEQSPAIIRMLLPLAHADEIKAGATGAATLVTQILPLAAERRSNPSDDLLSFIGADPELLLDDVVTTAVHIAVASHETTANLLGAAAIRLLTPGADGTHSADELDVNDPSLITELLRLDGPVQATARTATQPQRIGEVEIAPGQQVVVVVGAANRDPAVFDEPDRLVPGRRGPAPMTFGYGAHYCLGAALARLEIAVALRQILARDPVLSGPATWRDTPAIHGPLRLPMAFRR